ncbi:MAG TPA: hypothetical protein VLE91_01785 [Candidatus Saccharimonadales bacterium]|nr:hypothetical protein [Candidatus Saccharimonadales bacterium]
MVEHIDVVATAVESSGIDPRYLDLWKKAVELSSDAQVGIVHSVGSQAYSVVVSGEDVFQVWFLRDERSPTMMNHLTVGRVPDKDVEYGNASPDNYASLTIQEGTRARGSAMQSNGSMISHTSMPEEEFAALHGSFMSATFYKPLREVTPGGEKPWEIVLPPVK